MSARLIGVQVAGYHVLRRAAAGAVNEVYEALDLERGARVAVKVLQEPWCHDGEQAARFANEARALAGFQHPRIVTLLALGELADGRPFMILEWLPHNLGDALAARQGAVPPRLAARLVAQLAEALVELHRHGLVHRDLKPANVLLAEIALEVAELKLADLGLAKTTSVEGLSVDASEDAPNPAASPSLAPVSTGASALLGTWEYTAPEQWLHSKTAGAAADIYALGIVFFQLLTGRLPFLANEPQHWMYLHCMEPAPLELLDGVVPAATQAMLGRMLHKSSAARPSAGALVAYFASLAL